MQNSQGGVLKWVAGAKTPDDVYITRVFNYGTWQEWLELHKSFSRKQIRKVLQAPLRGQWTKRGIALAEAVYDLKFPPESVVSYEQ